MEKDFIPYEQALALKELGFDEPCVYYVDKDNNSYIYNFQTHPDEFIEWCGVNVIPTPILSQAFCFFREKYNSHHSITRLPQGALDADNKNNKVLKKYAWFISKDDLNPTIPNDGSGKCDTYEEAELACLVKLIEIVKQK